MPFAILFERGRNMKKWAGILHSTRGGAAPLGDLVTMVTSLLLSHFFFVPVKHAYIFLYPTNMAT